MHRSARSAAANGIEPTTGRAPPPTAARLGSSAPWLPSAELLSFRPAAGIPTTSSARYNRDLLVTSPPPAAPRPRPAWRRRRQARRRRLRRRGFPRRAGPAAPPPAPQLVAQEAATSVEPSAVPPCSEGQGRGDRGGGRCASSRVAERAVRHARCGLSIARVR